MQAYPIKKELTFLNNEYIDLCESLTELTLKLNKIVKKYLHQMDARILNEYNEYIETYRGQFIEIYKKLIAKLESCGYTENEILRFNEKINRFFCHMDILISGRKSGEQKDKSIKSRQISENLDTYSEEIIYSASIIKLSTILRENMAHCIN